MQSQDLPPRKKTITCETYSKHDTETPGQRNASGPTCVRSTSEFVDVIDIEGTPFYETLRLGTRPVGVGTRSLLCS